MFVFDDVFQIVEIRAQIKTLIDGLDDETEKIKV